MCATGSRCGGGGDSLQMDGSRSGQSDGKMRLCWICGRMNIGDSVEVTRSGLW